jgi:hypothetical protein
MKNNLIILSLLFIATLLWQCGNDGDPQPDTPAPTIASFTPTSGGVGATVTITGTNFSTTAASNVVKFNGKTATVTSATATSIITTVPTGTTTGKITVEVAGKTATSASDFTFLRYTTVSIFAGGATGIGSIDGIGTAAKFDNPYSIAKDSQGNLFVTDNSSHVIRKITPAGVVTTFAGTSGQAGDTNGTGAAARFRGLTGICIDASNNLYVAENLAHRIRKITPEGVVTTFAGSIDGTSGDLDATGTAARFNYPIGVAIDSQNNLYVADDINNKIRKISSTGVVTTLASSISSRFLFVSPQNVLYHATSGGINTMNTNTGASTLLAGSNSVNFYLDGIGENARFAGVRAMSMDTEGNLYVIDSGNYRIRKITPAGVVTTLAGNNTEATINGAIEQASFDSLIGIVVDRPSNTIYVTQGSGGFNLIRKID